MSTPLRAGIVGCSGIAIAKPERALGPYRMPVPHSHAAAFAAIPATEVVAICDIADEATRRYQESWGPAKGYRDFGELLESESLDLLSIVTPDHLHADVFVKACESGVRGIFCEKPIATTLADADRMIAAAERSGVKVVVNHTRRFDPFYRHAKWLIEQGTIGAVQRVFGSMGGERAMLFRNGTHVIDTILFFAPGDPVWVSAEFDAVDTGYGPVYRGDGGRTPSLDPGASAMIGFQDGTRAFFDGSKRSVTDFEIDVRGERGRLRIGNQVAELAIESPLGGLATQPLPLQADSRPGMVVAVDELIALVENDGDGVAALSAARTTLEVLLRILESADQDGARISFGRGAVA